MSVLLAKQKDIWYMYFFKTEKSLMLVHFQNGKMSDVGTFFKTEKCLMSVLFAKRENLWCRYFLQKPLMSVVFAKQKNVSTLPAPAPPAAAGYRLDLWGGGRTSPPGQRRVSALPPNRTNQLKQPTPVSYPDFPHHRQLFRNLQRFCLWDGKGILCVLNQRDIKLM